MNRNKYLSALLDAVTTYTADLDAAQLARFNEIFDPLTSKAARYVNRPWDTIIAQQQRLPRKIRRLKQLDDRRAAKKATKLAPATT